MKSSFLVVIITIIFIFLGLLNHDKINEFSTTYLDDFDVIEMSIKSDDWDQASDLLSQAKIDLEKEKNIWYKLINHEYFNEIFASLQVLNQSIYLKDKMISLHEIEKIKMVLENLMEDECYNFNRIF